MMINGLVGIREYGSLRWGWDLMMVAFRGVSESGGQGRSSLVGPGPSYGCFRNVI